MADKFIQVKGGKVVEKDGKDWVELTDIEEKTHRIFRSIQNSEGNWVHLDKEIDMLKGKIEDGSITGLAFKLNKEKKGTYWNVIGVESVKDLMKQQAIAEVQQTSGDNRERSIESQVAIKVIAELRIAEKITETDPLFLALKVWCLERLGAEVTIKPQVPETHKLSEIAEPIPPEAPQDIPATVAELMAYAQGFGKQFGPSWVRKAVGINDKEIITNEQVVEIYPIIKGALEKEG